MIAEKPSVRRINAGEHPENQPELQPVSTSDDGNMKVRPISFARGLAGVWIGAAVGSLLTLMTVAYPLGAGDTIAVVSMLPLAVTLVAVVTGWIAAQLFLDPGLH